MCQCKNSRSTKTHVLKAEPDVDQHQNQGYNNRSYGVSLHLGRDGRADRLCLNGGLLDAEILHQETAELLTLLHIHGSGLENDLIAAGNLLNLNVCVSGHLLKIRNNRVVDFLQGVIFIEGYTGGSSADEIKAVVQRLLSACLMNSHRNKAGQNDAGRNRKEHLFLLRDLQRLQLSSDTVPLFVLRKERIERLHVPLCNKQSCKHGKQNTDGQGLRKALDRAGSESIQDYGCDQRCHVAVDDCRQCLAVAVLDRRVHSLTVTKLLTDSGKHNDVCIHRHTDGKQNTCNTGKSQSHFKANQNDAFQSDIGKKCKARCKTGKAIYSDHENDHKNQTDQSRKQRGLDRILSKLRSDYVGTNLLQLYGKSADPDR